MSKYTVHFRGSRSECKEIAHRLAGILSGRESDDLGVAKGVHAAIGFAALSDIKQDFIRKSRGETGEDGVKWKRLSKEYLAYGRRFGRGEQATLKSSAGLGKGHRYGPGETKGLLTKEQLARWRQLFAMHFARLRLSLDDDEAKARAAMIAWAKLKSEGAKTKLEVYGNRQVDIGRDTGVLLNSLSPGELANSGRYTTYAKPTGDGGAEQVFELLGNGVIVGSNVKYAAAFNKLRPFIPEDGKIPATWQDRWLEVANQGVLVGLRMLLESAA